MLNYNKVQFVPEELSYCESLERLELAMNQDLNRLPDKVWATSLPGVIGRPAPDLGTTRKQKREPLVPNCYKITVMTSRGD